MVGPLFGKTYFPEAMLVLGRVYLTWHTQRFDKKIKTGHMEPLFFDLDINYILLGPAKKHWFTTIWLYHEA